MKCRNNLKKWCNKTPIAAGNVEEIARIVDKNSATIAKIVQLLVTS